GRKCRFAPRRGPGVPGGTTGRCRWPTAAACPSTDSPCASRARTRRSRGGSPTPPGSAGCATSAGSSAGGRKPPPATTSTNGRSTGSSRGTTTGRTAGSADRSGDARRGYRGRAHPGQVLVVDHVRRHRVDEVAERAQPHAFPHRSGRAGGHVDLVVELHHADG